MTHTPLNHVSSDRHRFNVHVRAHTARGHVLACLTKTYHAPPALEAFEDRITGSASRSDSDGSEIEVDAWLLFEHIVAQADPSMLAVCRLVTKRVYYSSPELTLRLLFAFINDVNSTIIPPETLVPAPPDHSSQHGVVASACEIPFLTRIHLMQSLATRLIHDVAVVQYTRQPASVHLLLSHCLLGLHTPNPNVQPLLAFLASILSPLNRAAVTHKLGKFVERLSHSQVRFAWHDDIVPLAWTATVRNVNPHALFADLVDSTDEVDGRDSLSIEHLISVLTEWTRVKFDDVVRLLGTDALRIALCSLDLEQVVSALKVYGCVLQPAGPSELTGLGGLMRVLVSLGDQLWTVRRPVQQYGVNVHATSLHGHCATTALVLALQICQHLAIAYHPRAALPELMPLRELPTGSAASASAGKSGLGRHMSHTVALAALSSTAAPTTVISPTRACSLPLVAPSMDQAAVEAFTTAYLDRHGAWVDASRPWKTESFLMHCQLCWLAVAMARTGIASASSELTDSGHAGAGAASIRSESLRLLRLVVTNPTFATFLRSFPHQMADVFHEFYTQLPQQEQSDELAPPPPPPPAMDEFGNEIPASARRPPHPTSTPRPHTNPNSIAALMSRWAALAPRGSTKLQRQHERFLLMGAQWGPIHFPGLQTVALIGLLQSASLSDALAILIQCWYIPNDLFVDPYPTRFLLNLVAVLPYLLSWLSPDVAAVSPATHADVQRWTGWARALAAAISASPVPDAEHYKPCAPLLLACAASAHPELEDGEMALASGQGLAAFIELVQYLVQLHFPLDAAAVLQLLTRQFVSGPVLLQRATLRTVNMIMAAGAMASPAAWGHARTLVSISSALVDDFVLRDTAAELVRMSQRVFSAEDDDIKHDVDDGARCMSAEALAAYHGIPESCACLDVVLERLPVLFGGSAPPADQDTKAAQDAKDARMRGFSALGQADGDGLAKVREVARATSDPTGGSVPTSGRARAGGMVSSTTTPASPLRIFNASAMAEAVALPPPVVIKARVGGGSSATPSPHPSSRKPLESSLMAVPVSDRTASLGSVPAVAVSPGHTASTSPMATSSSGRHSAPTLDTILADPAHSAALSAFADRINEQTQIELHQTKGVAVAEVLAFYMAALEFNAETNAASQHIKARSIVRRFIALDGLDTIPMDEGVRRNTLAAFEQYLQSAKPERLKGIFDEALQDSKTHLTSQVLPLYHTSPEYQALRKP
jgi:hypothetical protein